MTAVILTLLFCAFIIWASCYGDKWWANHNRPCAKCQNKRSPLVWCNMFNCWLCHACRDKEVERWTEGLMVEIRNRA